MSSRKERGPAMNTSENRSDMPMIRGFYRGNSRDRTYNLRINSPVLYLLSYIPELRFHTCYPILSQVPYVSGLATSNKACYLVLSRRGNLQRDHVSCGLYATCLTLIGWPKGSYVNHSHYLYGQGPGTTGGTRTHNLTVKSRELCQLSYGGV